MRATAVFLLCLVILVISVLVGCNITESPNKVYGRFIEVQEESGTIMGADYRIVYDRTTKVMYYMSDSMYNHCSLCPLYNADGSVMIYDNNEKENNR